MLRQDNFLVGFGAGLICSAIFYVIFVELNEVLMGTVLPENQGLSDQFIAILAVCSNLIPFLIFNAADKAKSMRGIIGATLVLATIAIVVYHDRFF